MIVARHRGGQAGRSAPRQGGFLDQQEAWRASRGVSRSSLNRLYSDLRNVEASSGVEAAASGWARMSPCGYPMRSGSCARGRHQRHVEPLAGRFGDVRRGGLSGFASGAGPAPTPTSTTGLAFSAGTVANCTGASVTHAAVDQRLAGGEGRERGRRDRAGAAGGHRLLPVSPGALRVQGLDGPPRPHGPLADPRDAPARPRRWPPRSPPPRGSTSTSKLKRRRKPRYRRCPRPRTGAHAQRESERTPCGSSAPRPQLTTSVFFTNRPD